MIKTLDITVQKLNLEKTFPGFICSLNRKKGISKLIVKGKIQPTPLSDNYNFQIVYISKKPPEITLLAPELISISNEVPIPHVYPGNKLCLYYKDWDSSKLISTNIIPWISEWLYYYEVWHATGEWFGGGIHLKKGSPKITPEKSVKNKFLKNK